MGKTNLAEIKAKLDDNKTAAGVAVEHIRPDISGSIVMEEKAAANDDAFWHALKDGMPEKYGHREVIRRLSLQKPGFEMASLHAKAALKQLPPEEARFLNDNLIYQDSLLIQLCSWLENVLYAHEALDL